MWELHLRLIPDYSGKIAIPLTGGLDSRVIAGIIGMKRIIDLGYYYWYPETKQNIIYVERLLKRLPYLNFEFIEVESYDRSKRKRMPIKILAKKYDLKKYTLVQHGFGDISTGAYWKLSKMRQMYCYHNFNLVDCDGKVKYFKSVENPLYHPAYIGYMHSLPRRLRLFQYAYIQMIREYLPHLCVERCYEKGSGDPTRLDYYPIRRISNKAKNAIKKLAL